ncbi:MAG: ATP-binding cassette domain-containing protein, partial [Geminicoccaceae bacterium]
MIFLAKDVVGGYSASDQILKGVTVTADAGEIVAILGPNGAGKSTLLKAVTGLLPQSTGTIRLEGVTLTGRRPRQIAERGVAYVP